MEVGVNTNPGYNPGVPLAGTDPAKDLALRMVRFSLTVNRMCKDLEIDSGVGEVVRDHLVYYSDSAMDDVRGALSARNPKRTRRLLTAAQKQMLKVMHWLDQLDNSGALAADKAQYCRTSGGSIIFDMGSIIAGRSPQAKGAEHATEHSALGEETLSDL